MAIKIGMTPVLDLPADLDPDRYSFVPGGRFVLDSTELPAAVWGAGQDVVWAEGESLMLASLQGLGKSTIGQQLALGRAGFSEYSELLGLPVEPGAGRVLYLAMDRPRQIQRSLRRMVGEAWRDELDARLWVWPGPPPRDLAQHPGVLTRMCEDAGADTCVVDSLKDAAVGLTDDEVGALWNRTRQHAIRAGVQLLELHHLRKAPNAAKGGHPGVDDVYGSTWLTSGCGSVVLLTGAPGDPVVGFHHVKQPAAEVGPFRIRHDHAAGQTALWHAADLVDLARIKGAVSAKDAACVIFEADKPTPAQREKARRRLEQLARDGLLVSADGDRATNTATLWRLP